MTGVVSDIPRVFFEKEDYFCAAKDLENSEHGGIAVALGLRVTLCFRIFKHKLIFVIFFSESLVNTLTIRPQKSTLRIKSFTSQMASPLHTKSV